MKIKPVFLAVLMCITCLFGFAQIEKNNRSSLSIEKIMQDPVKWIGSLPEDMYWDESGKNIFLPGTPKEIRCLHFINIQLFQEKQRRFLQPEKRTFLKEMAALTAIIPSKSSSVTGTCSCWMSAKEQRNS